MGAGAKFARRLATDESGQSILEYVLLLSAIVLGTTAMARGFLGILGKSVQGVGAQLEKDLKTGRVTVDIWSK